jgi:hypothetical protein
MGDEPVHDDWKPCCQNVGELQAHSIPTSRTLFLKIIFVLVGSTESRLKLG